MTAAIRTFHQAKRVLRDRLGPESPEDARLTSALDMRLRRIEREHRDAHAEMGVELCYACDWPLVDVTRVVEVTIANRGGIAKCCGNLCASKVKQLIGDPTI